jgi:NAD(P)-dependent dehydrogenase (short-subunit alcohol dehydrogenase family)
MKIEGYAALVTGSASGLGRATAERLRDAGALVHGFDLGTSFETNGVPDGVQAIAGDVTDHGDVEAAVANVGRSSADLRLVVSCAGVAPSARVVGRRGKHDLALFRRVVDINLGGTFNVLASAAALMADNEPDADGARGVIINTASIAAYDGQIGQAAYAASKGGVAALTLPVARDLARHGIRVCTIAPGIVDTPMMAGMTEEVREQLGSSVPFPQRMCRPDEFADLVVALTGHDYLNGEVIRMDGALRMAAR